MKEAPLVTVYITNFNYGSYIKDAIESVLNQSFKDIELIIIDDGSSDNSKEIIERYMQLNYVRVIFQKNKGLNITNNIAMRLARGKYLVRLDADDYFRKDAIQKMCQKDAIFRFWVAFIVSCYGVLWCFSILTPSAPI